MEVIKTIFYFAITIGVLVLVHEFGHFIAAKFSKMRVEVFSIGFGARLFGRKLVKLIIESPHSRSGDMLKFPGWLMKA
jgi:membrane-associated protease RseP (regulator of RpoE activity)